MCGEKINSIPPFKEPSGSPPHVRGKVVRRSTERRVDGITPACAGKRGLRKFSSAQAQDHPRVCGEKHCTSTPIALVSGSPPRMRGKAVEMKLAGTVHGITPACAGKSRRKTTDRFCSRDHPRMCGEKSQEVHVVTSFRGSPPRMRGKAVHHKHRHSPGRITPAHAGKRG